MGGQNPLQGEKKNKNHIIIQGLVSFIHTAQPLLKLEKQAVLNW